MSALAILAVVQQAVSPGSPSDHHWRDKIAATPAELARKAHNDALKPAFARYQYCVYNTAMRMASSREAAPVVAESAVQKCRRMRAILFADFAATFTDKRAFFGAFDEHVLAEAKMQVVDLRSRTARKK